MRVELISITQPHQQPPQTAEGIIAYCARVSSPNQDNPDYEKLLRYCIREKHWSIFEMADMTVEITTTRAIAAQILRHKSFSFQERSLRYAEGLKYESCEARRQDDKNRQNSIDDLDDEVKRWFGESQFHVWRHAKSLYDEAIANGIAKECARMLLPLNTVTRLYMKGSVRSWIHYFDVRCHPSTQKEHRDIATAIRDIFTEQFPAIAKALDY
jgi:thymidylate synthase (FAD)